MPRPRPADDDGAGVIPDGFAEDAAKDKGFVHLPFEAGSADPQELEYANLPDVTFDPAQDWREAQKGTARRMFGEYAPDDDGDRDHDQEATDG